MIEITHYETAAKGKICAFLDISIAPWGIIIRRIAKVINNGKTWYNMPTFPKDMPDGSKRFIPYVQFTTNNIIFTEKLTEAVLAYEAKLAATKNEPEMHLIEDKDLPF